MREHDEIVKNLKSQLILKGFKVLSLQRREAKIAQIGYDPERPKVSHVAFVPDIVISINDNDEDRFFIEYTHTKSMISHDVKGMILLSERIQKARGFILILNDNIFVPLKGIEGNVFSMSLTGFLKDLNKYPKEVFIRLLQG